MKDKKWRKYKKIRYKNKKKRVNKIMVIMSRINKTMRL
jgi:hypothetical protein